MSMEDSYSASFFAQSGKLSDKWSSYLSAYDYWFSSVRDKPLRILEIGVQNGGHLEVLARYFKNAELIIGCDINPACANLQYRDNRIKVILGDANDDATSEKISALSANFDIVIDDGSHTQHDIIASFSRYFPRLNFDGIYLAEDLHTSYWREFGGGLFNPRSSVEFFRRLADVINSEHWTNGLTVSDFIAFYEEAYRVRLEAETLRHVHMVAFQNSISVVLKKESDKNLLGSRIVVGDEAVADPVPLQLNGTHLLELRQSDRPLTTLKGLLKFAFYEIGKIKGYKDTQFDHLLRICMSKINSVR